MAVSKCVKCCAKIPEGAGFCPACGAPKAVEQPVPQSAPAAPAPQPVAPTPQPILRGPSSILGIIETVFSETIMFVMIFLGLLLASIGGLIFLFAGDYNIYRVALIINVLGFIIMGLFLLMGGISNKNYDKFVRLGMIIGGAIMITLSTAIAA